MSLYMYATLLKFFAFYVVTRQTFFWDIPSVAQGLYSYTQPHVVPQKTAVWQQHKAPKNVAYTERDMRTLGLGGG